MPLAVTKPVFGAGSGEAAAARTSLLQSSARTRTAYLGVMLTALTRTSRATARGVELSHLDNSLIKLDLRIAMASGLLQRLAKYFRRLQEIANISS